MRATIGDQRRLVAFKEIDKMVPPRYFAPLMVFALATLAPSGSACGEEGSPCDGGRSMLIREWRVEGVPGTEGRPARGTIECLSDGRLRQVVEVSEDGGVTWSTLFEQILSPPPEPVAAMEPTAAIAPEPEPPAEAPASGAVEPEASPASEQPEESPAPEPAPAQHQAARQANEQGSEVQAVSRELQREEISADEAPELVMASPMVLEITPGQVDLYPENAAWTTEETAGFVCNQVVVKKVSVARRSKGGDVHLLVGAQLFTEKRQRSLDLLVEALMEGEVVASEELDNVSVGLNIPGHTKTGMLVEARLEMSAEQFERLFSDGVERKLRLTVTSPPD